MKCERCGTVINDNEQFCHGCGSKIIKNDVNMFEGVVNQNTINNVNNYNQANNVPNNSNSSLGTISIIIGIAAIILNFKWSIFALILSIVGLIVASSYKKQTNKKTAGKVLNIISLILSILSNIFKILLVVGIGILGALFGDVEDDEVSVSGTPSTDSSTATNNNSASSSDSLTCIYNGDKIEDELVVKYNSSGTPISFSYKATTSLEDVSISGSTTGGFESTGNGEEISEADTTHSMLMTTLGMAAQYAEDSSGIKYSLNESAGTFSVEVDFTKTSDTVKESFSTISGNTKQELNDYLSPYSTCK